MVDPVGVQALKQRPFVIVVGVDFHETGDHALAESVRLARARGDSELHMVHVVSQSTAPTREADHIAWMNNVLATLPSQMFRHVLDRAEAMGGLPADAFMHVRLGKTAEAIAQFCIDYDADLVIVGTHNRRGVAKMMLGSVADDLVHTARCPVMVARPKDYSGLNRTEKPEPECQDCIRVRKQSQGATMWCEFHGRPHVRPHVYGFSSSMGFGSAHDPGIVPD